MDKCESGLKNDIGSLEGRILKILRNNHDGINLSFLNSLLSDASYSQIRYQIEKMEDDNLVHSEELDGLRWVFRADRDSFSDGGRTVNLRNSWHDSNMDGEALYRRFMEAEIGDIERNSDNSSQMVRGLKTEAGKLVNQWTELPDWAMDKLDDLFMAYLEEINDLSLVFKRSEGEVEEVVKRDLDNDSEYLILDYETRFNSRARRNSMWARYYGAWAKATAGYDHEKHGLQANLDKEKGFNEGVFLTLTTDPKRFDSNREAVKHISEAWNRFMSWIKRKKGFRPPYIKVLEFTQDGKPHLHVVFFGIGRIASQMEVSNRWSGHGQGEIIHLHKIQNDGDGEWYWPNGKPDKAENDDDKDYNPIKYLSNEFSKQMKEKKSLALHWIHQTNFFTTSKNLKVYSCRDCGKVFQKKKKKETHEIECSLKKAVLESDGWEFMASIPHELMDSEIVENGQIVLSEKISKGDLFDLEDKIDDN